MKEQPATQKCHACTNQHLSSHSETYEPRLLTKIRDQVCPFPFEQEVSTVLLYSSIVIEILTWTMQCNAMQSMRKSVQYSVHESFD